MKVFGIHHKLYRQCQAINDQNKYKISTVDFTTLSFMGSFTVAPLKFRGG